MMNRLNGYVVAALVALALMLGAAGAAVAQGAFNNAPPTSAGWMTRPCKDSADDTTILTQNCYWTTAMGTWTDANGNPVTVGFWIRKIPNQPLICYIYSPDDANNGGDTCYSTTSDRIVFLNKTFYLNN